MSTEHKAVLDPAKRLEREGVRLTVLGPQKDGRLNLEELRAAHPAGHRAGERDVRQ